MSSYLQNMKDFAANHFSAVGLSAAVGVVLYYTLSHCPSYKKIRPRSVSPADYSELANNQTLMAKYLTPDVYAKIKGKTTPRCFSLYALIQCGIENPFNPGGKSSGLLTGDQECYEVFNELLEPVIRELHGVRGSEIAVRTDMNWHKLKGGNIVNKNVDYCMLSASRNIEGLPLIPGCDVKDIREIDEFLYNCLKCLKDRNLRGSSIHIKDLVKRPQAELDLFADYEVVPDPRPTQLSRDWPHGRFVWWTLDRRCKVFINFQDHIKFVVTQAGSDIKEAFKKYCELMRSVEDSIQNGGRRFLWSEKYGFLASSPLDIGTSLRVDVKVRLPNLGKDSRLVRIVSVLPIECRHSDSGEENAFHVYNNYKLEQSEVEILQQVIDSLTLLLELDKRLGREEDIRDLLP